MSPRTTAFLASLLLLLVGAGGQFQRDRIDPMVIFHLSYQTIITKSGLFPIGSCYPLGPLHQCFFLSISHLPFRAVPMAPNFGLKSLAILALTLAICVQGSLGGITCENLNKDTCAFAVSSSGKRCVLEKHARRSGEEAYVCRTSEIEADKVKDWVESDQCIEACGLDRKSLGISSDSLLECGFTRKLCSTQCYNGCPNIVDLYFNLAAGEGVFLPKLCEAQRGDARREMAEIRSSGFVAPGPVSGVNSVKYVVAPAVAPTSA